MRFLSIGECMAELAPLDRPGDFRLGFAGDTFNTAWYMSLLRPDLEVSYLSAVGCDDMSDRMLLFMDESGIGTGHVARHPGRSVGMYLISLNNGERSFSYWRDTSAARLLADDPAALTRAMDGADLVYFSGITLAILSEAARGRFIDALKTARGKGKKIAFDPNLRAHLWDGPSRMTDTIMQGAAASDIILPSFEDEARWFDDTDPEATLNRYAQAGAETIIVKNGAEAVLYRTGDARGSVDVPRVRSIVDTTAAGDSFNAAILAGFSTGTPLPDNIALACQLAGQVVQAKGALVPISLSVLDQFQ